eukprot:scaffold18524_cov24-Prasinocladus_malaysianus.AAC.1
MHSQTLGTGPETAQDLSLFLVPKYSNCGSAITPKAKYIGDNHRLYIVAPKRPKEPQKRG